MSSSDFANFLSVNGLKIFKINPATGNEGICYCRIVDNDQGIALIRQLHKVGAEGHIGNFRGAHAVIITGGVAKVEELGIGSFITLSPEKFIDRLRAEHQEAQTAGVGK